MDRLIERILCFTVYGVTLFLSLAIFQMPILFSISASAITSLLTCNRAFIFNKEKRTAVIDYFFHQNHLFQLEEEKQSNQVQIYQRMNLHNFLESHLEKDKQQYVKIKLFNLFAELEASTDEQKKVYTCCSHAYTVYFIKKLERRQLVKNVRIIKNEEWGYDLSVERHAIGNTKREQFVTMYDVSFEKTEQPLTRELVDILNHDFHLVTENYYIVSGEIPKIEMNYAVQLEKLQEEKSALMELKQLLLKFFLSTSIDPEKVKVIKK